MSQSKNSGSYSRRLNSLHQQMAVLAIRFSRDQALQQLSDCKLQEFKQQRVIQILRQVLDNERQQMIRQLIEANSFLQEKMLQKASENEQMKRDYNSAKKAKEAESQFILDKLRECQRMALQSKFKESSFIEQICLLENRLSRAQRFNQSQPSQHQQITRSVISDLQKQNYQAVRIIKQQEAQISFLLGQNEILKQRNATLAGKLDLSLNETNLRKNQKLELQLQLQQILSKSKEQIANIQTRYDSLLTKAQSGPCQKCEPLRRQVQQLQNEVEERSKNNRQVIQQMQTKVRQLLDRNKVSQREYSQLKSNYASLQDQYQIIQELNKTSSQKLLARQEEVQHFRARLLVEHQLSRNLLAQSQAFQAKAQQNQELAVSLKSLKSERELQQKQILQLETRLSSLSSQSMIQKQRYSKVKRKLIHISRTLPFLKAQLRSLQSYFGQCGNMIKNSCTKVDRRVQQEFIRLQSECIQRQMDSKASSQKRTSLQSSLKQSQRLLNLSRSDLQKKQNQFKLQKQRLAQQLAEVLKSTLLQGQSQHLQLLTQLKLHFRTQTQQQLQILQAYQSTISNLQSSLKQLTFELQSVKVVNKAMTQQAIVRQECLQRLAESHFRLEEQYRDLGRDLKKVRVDSRGTVQLSRVKSLRPEGFAHIIYDS